MTMMGRKKLSTKDLRNIYESADIQERSQPNNIQLIESKLCSLLFKILIVEDNENFAFHLKNLLHSTTKFRNVVYSKNVEESLDLLNKMPIKLVISNYTFKHEEKGGRHIFWHMKEKYPNIPFIIADKGNLTDTQVNNLKEAGIPILEKPVSVLKLVEFINKAYLEFLDKYVNCLN